MRLKPLIIAVVALFYTSYAQEGVPTSLFNPLNKKYDQSVEKMYQQRSVLNGNTQYVLERAIVPEKYIVGPGDVFEVTIFSELETKFEFAVLPNGNITIPTVGALNVNEKKLTHVIDKIIHKVKQKYANADVAVNLVALRRFRVYLTGEVLNPGTYFLQASDRLADLLDVAKVAAINKTFTSWANDTKIKITKSDSTIIEYDVTAFFNNGELDQNPTLNGGDLVYVPPIKLNENQIVVEGNRKLQGFYQIKKGEKLYNFLKRIDAFNEKVDLTALKLVRNGKSETISAIDGTRKIQTQSLLNGDTLIINNKKVSVYIRGAVRRPGAFAFIENYTVADYIGMAGGIPQSEDLDNAYVIRAETNEIFDGLDVIVKKGDTIVVPIRTRELFKEYVTILAPLVTMSLSLYAVFTASK